MTIHWLNLTIPVFALTQKLLIVKNSMSKVYLLTGTSIGCGRTLAEAVLERSDKVVLTARKPEQVAP